MAKKFGRALPALTPHASKVETAINGSRRQLYGQHVCGYPTARRCAPSPAARFPRDNERRARTASRAISAFPESLLNTRRTSKVHTPPICRERVLFPPGPHALRRSSERAYRCVHTRAPATTKHEHTVCLRSERMPPPALLLSSS